MSNIINMNALTMTSREIAELTGKAHSNVMRDVRAMMDALEQDSKLNPVCRTTTYRGSNGQDYDQYELDKDTCLTLMLGYDAVARMKVVKRWQELETQQGRPIIPQSLPEALRLAADLAERNEALALERDEAVRTKAQIGSKREASAMAKASAAVREADRLRGELGRNQHHATIIAVEQVTGQKFPRNAYVALRKWCKSKGVSPVEVVDERYGMVKAWPAGAWQAAFDIDLKLLFGAPFLHVVETRVGVA